MKNQYCILISLALIHISMHTSAQLFFSPNNSVRPDHSTIETFSNTIDAVTSKKADYYKIPPQVIKTIAIVQSNSGEDIVNGYNLGRVMANTDLKRFKAFGTNPNYGLLTCSTLSIGIEAISLAMHLMRDNQKHTLPDRQWFEMIFGTNGDLHELASEASIVYNMLTGAHSGDFQIKRIRPENSVTTHTTRDDTIDETTARDQTTIAKDHRLQALHRENELLQEELQTLRSQHSGKELENHQLQNENKRLSTELETLRNQLAENQKESMVPNDQRNPTTTAKTDAEEVPAQTQSSEEIKVIRPDLRKKPLSGFVGLGYRPLSYNNHSLAFRYTDESPSRDRISSTFFIPSNSSVLTVHGGLEQYFPSGWMLKLNGEFYLNSIGGGGVELGGGHIFEPISGLIVMPSVGLGINWVKVPLGQISQNAQYIQVNETQFYSPTVSVGLSSPSLTLRPELIFSSDIYDNYFIRLAAGYHHTISKLSNDLIFHGEGQNGDSLRAIKPLSAANADLFLDGFPLETTFANPQGIFVNLSFGIYID